jgi:hypothetical protein
MTTTDPAIFHRALRAAAAVTGVLKRQTAIGLAAGSLSLVLAACDHGSPAQRAPSNTGMSVPRVVAIDAGIDANDDCSNDPGWGSDCCKAVDNRRAACMAWGPPAPPAFTGERLS